MLHNSKICDIALYMELPGLLVKFWLIICFVLAEVLFIS